MNKSRFIKSKQQSVSLSKRNIEGLVLDVGGGGEGIIGLLYGSKTVAIDNRMDELEETRNDALKIVMDAGCLGFLDETFQMAAFFYSLMYMDCKTKANSIKEAARVLKPGGLIEIWDTEIPVYTGGEKDIFIAELAVCVDKTVIKPSYGVGYEDKEQTAGGICSICEKYGLMIISSESSGKAFHILASKL